MVVRAQNKGLNLSQHINGFTQVVSDLRKFDVKFKKEDKSLLHLNSLLNLYENSFIILTWYKESMMLEDITSVLLWFHQRRKTRYEQIEVLVVRGNYGDQREKDGRGSKSKLRRFKGNYFECKEKGT